MCRLGSFSFEVRLRLPCVETRDGRSQLNANAKVFKQNAEFPTKRGAKDPKDSFDQHDFNWTPPSVSQETPRGLNKNSHSAFTQKEDGDV